MRSILTILFATLLLSTSIAQSNVNKPDIEFKTIKLVGDKQNVYFDITGITDNTQITEIAEALENYSEVYKCNIYNSSYNSHRCMLITSNDVDALIVEDILKEQGVNYDLRTVRVNNRELLKENIPQ